MKRFSTWFVFCRTSFRTSLSDALIHAHKTLGTCPGLLKCCVCTFALQFLLKLMKRQPYTNIDPATKSTMIIHPVTLAQQVLAARDELAGASAKGLVHHVKNANLDVIKTHLNQNHYTLSRKVRTSHPVCIPHPPPSYTHRHIHSTHHPPPLELCVQSLGNTRGLTTGGGAVYAGSNQERWRQATRRPD